MINLNRIQFNKVSVCLGIQQAINTAVRFPSDGWHLNYWAYNAQEAEPQNALAFYSKLHLNLMLLD